MTTDTNHEPTPTPIEMTPRARMVLVFAVLAVAVLVLWLAPVARTMLVGGFTLAIYLSLLVNVAGRYMRRPLAVVVVFVGLIVLAAIAFFTFVPAVIDQLEAAIPELSDSQTPIRDALADLLQPLIDRGVLGGSADELAGRVSTSITDNLGAVLVWLLNALLALLSNIAKVGFVLFGVILVALYMLLDTNRYRNLFVLTFPPRYQRDARGLWDSLANGISRYLSGLAISMADQGALAALMLWIAGVPFFLLFGIWMALTAIIPYIGAWLGAAPAVIVAWAVHGLGTAVVIGLGYFAINTFDSRVVQPLVFGAVLKVPAIAIYLAVIIGGQLWGALGAILSVPAVAMIRIVIDFLRERLRPVPSESGEVMGDDGAEGPAVADLRDQTATDA